MTVSSTPRLGLTQWSDDLDPPISRAQMNADFGDLEALAAIALRGTLASRPPAGTRERLYLVDSGASVGSVFWDTGTGWVQISGPRTFRQPFTFSVPGEIGVAAGQENVVPGFFVPSPPGQTVRLVAARHVVGSGTATVEVRVAGAAWTTLTVGTTATTSDPADITVGDGQLVQPVVTGSSGPARNLSLTLYADVTV